MRYVILFIVLLLAANFCDGQDSKLAQNYMDQGEFTKALNIYQKLYQQNKRNQNNVFALIDVYHELERYQSVDSLLDDAQLGWRSDQPFIIERGYNQVLQGNDSLGEMYYQKALSIIDSLPQMTYQIANRFERRNELEEAIQAYEIGMAANPKLNFTYQLARLYGEQGQLEKMFDVNIKMIEDNAVYRSRAQAIFSQYVTDDPENEGNQLLRKVLLLRLRENPDPIYNQLLSWLFVQQKDFEKAFIQEKAIYKRTESNMDNLQDLVNTALDEGDLEAAESILEYMISETQSRSVKYIAQSLQLRIKANRSTPEQFDTIIASYDNLLSIYGRDAETFRLQLDYADFLAFKADQPKKASDILVALEKTNLSKFQQADVKMKLADILVLQEQFNRALILYSQVQNDLPNDTRAQEAQFKVARASYFQGDFPWSLTQLKVLRSAASKLIANDAMELSLVISDHSLEDTTFVALKAFAKADLKQYQNKRKEAISDYSQLLLNHKGDPIEDEALVKQAQLYQQEGEFEKARNNYQLVIENYADGILADDAYYQLGLLYQEHLEDPIKAQEYFEKIIFNHADSIHFVDARRRYRSLRGDENTKAF
ncbi:tetratricopeptide repeat protein [Nonlabens xiamenensis]|uniref:tetratricopeptide repeat protein n=1 Tax=Nonlabens xiamenensis TaxID=2341043 RepID=UPI001F0C0D85|nr:tetratricopeptide repeat protein [Nonlabens xiamenensis]